MLRFALCADDYALTPGVSRGILELVEAGRLSAVSVLVTAPKWPQAAGELKPFASAADIGLHLNLTLGAPLGALPGLAPANQFPALGLLVRSALLGRLPLAEIAAEIARQIDSFAQYLGRLPDFIDGHQHVHALPGVRDALLQVLVEQHLGGRLWLRDPGDRLHAIVARPLRRKALALAALTAGFASQAETSGFAVDRDLRGFQILLPHATTRRSSPPSCGRPDRGTSLCAIPDTQTTLSRGWTRQRRAATPNSPSCCRGRSRRCSPSIQQN